MPSQTDSRSIRREDGTASIELIAAIPFLLLAVLVAAQLALVGHALWSAGMAARAGARAAVVGQEAGGAARRALPASMRDEAEVSDEGTVSVRVPVPRLFSWLPQISVGAETALGAGDG